MRARSLRLRLMILAAITIAVTLTAAGASLVLVFERHLKARLGLELEARWTEIARAFTLGDDGEPRLAYAPADPRYDQPYSGIYYTILPADGPDLRSRSLWDSELARVPPAAPDERNGPVETSGPNGGRLYMVAKPVSIAHPTGDKAYTISVAIDHAEIDAMAGEFAAEVRLALLVLALLLLSGTWAQIVLGLKPLDALRAELDRIRTGRAERLAGQFPEELEPLVSDLNGLLERQDALVRRARERAGTLAHGLKTPLTIIQGEARKLARMGATEVAQVLRDQVEAMDTHVARELSRARLQGRQVGSGQWALVAATARRIVDLERRLPGGDGLTWVVQVPDGLRARMDAADLAEILGNLVDNARKWARSRVVVGAALEAGRLVIEVADDGPGIPDGMRDRVLERGVRASGEVEGSGLGLSIVGEVLEAHDGRLVMETAQGGGCRARVVVDGFCDGADVPRAILPSALLASLAEPGPTH